MCANFILKHFKTFFWDSFYFYFLNYYAHFGYGKQLVNIETEEENRSQSFMNPCSPRATTYSRVLNSDRAHPHLTIPADIK